MGIIGDMNVIDVNMYGIQQQKIRKHVHQSLASLPIGIRNESDKTQFHCKTDVIGLIPQSFFHNMVVYYLYNLDHVQDKIYE